MQVHFITLVLVLLTSSPLSSTTSRISLVSTISFDVVEYGAIGDGKTDDSQVFMKAWKAACQSTPNNMSMLNIPSGRTYLLMPIAFSGPCKPSKIFVQVSGNIVGSNNKTDWMSNHGDSWLLFSMVSGLTVSGKGQIDGQGPIWWENACIGTPSPGRTCHAPVALQFKRCIGLRLSGLTHVNSPRVHITITTCNNVIVSNLHIIAPETSPNTDGIDISGSTNVNIHDSIIATGDDCIAIGGGSSYIKISGIMCGPGHGIREELDMQKRSHLQASSLMQFIILSQSTNTTVPLTKTTAVNLSDITYRGISGTSNTDNVINLSCSRTVACTNVVVDNVHIKSSIPGRKVYGSCINACGRATHVQPYLDCLKPSIDLCNGPLG